MPYYVHVIHSEETVGDVFDLLERFTFAALCIKLLRFYFGRKL